MGATFKGQLTKPFEDHPDVLTDVGYSLAPASSQNGPSGFTTRALSDSIEPPKEPPVLDNVIRVSFPADIPKGLQNRYKEVKGKIDAWHSWVQGKSAELIAAKQKSGELPINVEKVDSKIKVDNYGARVFDTILTTRSPWLPVFYRDRKSLNVTEKKFDLHNTILKTVLNDFVSEPRLLAKLEAAFDLITKAISFGVNKTRLDRSIWVMLEYYVYDADVDEIRTVVRVIAFDAGVESREYTSNKANFKEVNTKLDYVQTDAKFVESTWETAENEIKQAIAEAAKRAVTEELDIPV